MSCALRLQVSELKRLALPQIHEEPKKSAWWSGHAPEVLACAGRFSVNPLYETGHIDYCPLMDAFADQS